MLGPPKIHINICECDLSWQQDLCRCNQVKMRSHWIRVGPKSNMTGVLLKGKFGHRHRGTESFPGGSVVIIHLPTQETRAQIPGLGRSPGEGNGNPLQYSCPGNPMDRGAWWATVHGVAKSQTRQSDSRIATEAQGRTLSEGGVRD